MLLTSRIVKEHKSRAGTIQTRFILGIKCVYKYWTNSLKFLYSEKATICMSKSKVKILQDFVAFWTLTIDPWKIWNTKWLNKAKINFRFLAMQILPWKKFWMPLGLCLPENDWLYEIQIYVLEKQWELND